MASVTVTASQRAANKKKNSGSSGSVSSGSSQNSTPKYDPNKDYAAAIQDAARSGASQSVIDQLNSERNAKIAGMGLNQSALTDDDIAGYRNGKTTATNTNVSGFNVNPTDDDIRGLAQSQKYDPNNLKGYADPEGYYTTRQTAYTWKQPDGTFKTTYSNATNQAQALKDAIAAGQIASGSSLAHSSTYGTGSLSGNGYNYGVTVAGNGMSGFGNGSDGGRYTSDKQYSNMYDQNNMQFQFLSGRDGMDYSNPYAGLAYQGNGMTNAYNKGTGFAGQGNIMGGYNVNFQYPDGSTLDDVIANYGNNYDYSGSAYPEYNGITAQDIADQMKSVYENYQNSMEGVNSALAQSYAYQQEQRNKEADDAARALYVNKRIAQRDMPQQLAAQGITGGMSESALLGLNTSYENAYQQNESARTDAVTQLDIAKNTAIANNNMQMAGVLADLQQSSIQLQQSAAQYENQFNLSVAQMRQAQSQFEQQMAYQQAQDAWNQQYQMLQLERENTQLAAQYAYQMGDYDTIANLYDIDTSYAKKMQEYELLGAQLDYEADILSLNKAKSSGSGRSGGGSSSGASESNSVDDDILLAWGDAPNVSTTRKQGTVTSGQSASVDPYALITAMRKTVPSGGRTLL